MNHSAQDESLSGANTKTGQCQQKQMTGDNSALIIFSLFGVSRSLIKLVKRSKMEVTLVDPGIICSIVSVYSL